MSEDNLSDTPRFVFSFDFYGHFVYHLKAPVVDLVNTDYFAAASKVGTCGYRIGKANTVHTVINRNLYVRI